MDDISLDGYDELIAYSSLSYKQIRTTSLDAGGYDATASLNVADATNEVTMEVIVTIPNNEGPEEIKHVFDMFNTFGFKHRDIRSGDKDNTRHSFVTILGTVPAKQITAPTRTAPYDPKQAYFDRMTPAARSRQARISQSQYRDSYGGDSSNYRF